MIPPQGFKSEIYPLRHRLLYSFGLSATTSTMNSAFCTLIRHTSDVIAGTPGSIVVNPHHTGYVNDAGPAVAKMSIIDKLSMTLRFNMTSLCNNRALTSGTAGPNFDDGVYIGDGIQHLKLLWRPVFFSFGEKLDAQDDDIGTTVGQVLALTKDATFEDVVPLTTNDLPQQGASKLDHPVSTVNIAEVFGDYNMLTDMKMEDHVWDEDVFQEAIRRYTIKGAIKSMVGRTRYVNLSKAFPYKSYNIRKFVPRSIRRVMPYTFMGIQIHMPRDTEIGSDYADLALTASQAHVGVKLICNYHEWNADHYQEMSGTPP